MATARILTRLHKKGKDPVARLAEFTECIVDYFDGTDGEATICTWLENNSLIISNDFSKSTHKLHIKHPSFCPIKGLKTTPMEIAENRKSSGINVGVCIILESADHEILLTKRASHLHAFPNIWVPPGGHIDMDETITHAGLRELREETGLDIKESDCLEGKLVPLAIWESVYPPRLSLGAPSRHNVVLYLHAMLVPSLTTAVLFHRLKFDPNEVAACVFVDHKVAAAIVKESEEREEGEKVDHDPTLPQALRGLVLDEHKNQVEADVPLTPFFQRSTYEGDCERVSTGTKYALEQFLFKNKL